MRKNYLCYKPPLPFTVSLANERSPLPLRASFTARAASAGAPSMRSCVMAPQQVLPEVPRAAAPHLVHVIAVALHVVVLEQKVSRLYPVVVRLVLLEPADPRELEL